VEIAEFLTKVIPLICRSLRLMMKWYSVEFIESTVAKSVDVEMIRHGFSPPGERSLILKLLLALMDAVLSSMNGKS